MKDVSSKAKYRELRVRVSLRKSLGREPTEGEVGGRLATSDQSEKFKLPMGDILKAFEGRAEVTNSSLMLLYSLSHVPLHPQSLHIWRLECVGYDEGFQQRLAREYPPYVLAHPKKAQAA